MMKLCNCEPDQVKMRTLFVRRPSPTWSWSPIRPWTNQPEIMHCVQKVVMLLRPHWGSAIIWTWLDRIMFDHVWMKEILQSLFLMVEPLEIRVNNGINMCKPPITWCRISSIHRIIMTCQVNVWRNPAGWPWAMQTRTCFQHRASLANQVFCEVIQKAVLGCWWFCHGFGMFRHGFAMFCHVFAMFCHGFAMFCHGLPWFCHVLPCFRFAKVTSSMRIRDRWLHQWPAGSVEQRATGSGSVSPGCLGDHQRVVTKTPNDVEG